MINYRELITLLSFNTTENLISWYQDNDKYNKNIYVTLIDEKHCIVIYRYFFDFKDDVSENVARQAKYYRADLAALQEQRINPQPRPNACSR